MSVCMVFLLYFYVDVFRGYYVFFVDLCGKKCVVISFERVCVGS